MKAAQTRPLMPTDEPERLKQLGQLPCGFPSPGLDHEDSPLSLDELVGMRAPSIFMGRAARNSMRGRGIFDRDGLIINSPLEPASGDVSVARIGADFTVETFVSSAGVKLLKAENPDSPPMHLGGDEQVEVGLGEVQSPPVEGGSMSKELTFQALMAMKLSRQQLKFFILTSLTREDIIRLNNEGVARLEQLETRKGKCTQLRLSINDDDDE
jgi:DNA polymerase V